MKKTTFLSLLAALIIIFAPAAVNAQETTATPTSTPTPTITSTPTPTTAPTSVEESTTSADQPALPDELPATGPEDWLKWIVSGLAMIGIGLLLF